VDIVTITGSFLDPSVFDAEICPDSYSVFRRGGGVLLLVRDNLQVLPRYDISNLCEELLWLQIFTNTGPLVFYSPPSQDINNLKALHNCLLSIVQYPIILCGDFNCHLFTGCSHFLLYYHPLIISCVI